MKHKTPKDPFHKPEPQVSNVYQGQEPEELRGFDDAKGGIPVKHNQITDPNHRAKFVAPQEEEHDFGKKGGK